MNPAQIESEMEMLAAMLASALSPSAAAEIIRNLADMVESLGETKQ